MRACNLFSKCPDRHWSRDPCCPGTAGFRSEWAFNEHKVTSSSEKCGYSCTHVRLDPEDTLAKRAIVLGGIPKVTRGMITGNSDVPPLIQMGPTSPAADVHRIPLGPSASKRDFRCGVRLGVKCITDGFRCT